MSSGPERDAILKRVIGRMFVVHNISMIVENLVCRQRKHYALVVKILQLVLLWLLVSNPASMHMSEGEAFEERRREGLLQSIRAIVRNQLHVMSVTYVGLPNRVHVANDVLVVAVTNSRCKWSVVERSYPEVLVKPVISIAAECESTSTTTAGYRRSGRNCEADGESGRHEYGTGIHEWLWWVGKKKKKLLDKQESSQREESGGWVDLEDEGGEASLRCAIYMLRRVDKACDFRAEDTFLVLCH